jgi:predicted alpha/beta hydrolase family esterase
MVRFSIEVYSHSFAVVYIMNRPLIYSFFVLGLLFATFPGASWLAPCHAQLGPLEEKWQSMREQLRNAIAPLSQPQYELRLLARQPRSEPAANNSAESGKYEQFDLSKLPKRVVLVVSGLQSNGDSAESFAKALELAMEFPPDTRMGVFDYPNDGSIRESGEVLRQLLQKIQESSPHTKVTIVSHSMGGLVSRWAIESPNKESREPKVVSNVDQLVLICPPNQGSVLARYADALEISDAMAKLQRGKESFPSIVFSLIDDGLGEACDELVPQSDFLKELNGLNRAAHVHYSIIAGTRGPISPIVRTLGMIAIREGRNRAQANGRKVSEQALKRVDELLSSEELASGLGDGAVSLKSAQLQGVTEFTKFPIHHAEWANLSEPIIQELLMVVAEKITKK